MRRVPVQGIETISNMITATARSMRGRPAIAENYCKADVSSNRV